MKHLQIIKFTIIVLLPIIAFMYFIYQNYNINLIALKIIIDLMLVYYIGITIWIIKKTRLQVKLIDCQCIIDINNLEYSVNKKLFSNLAL